MIKRLLLTIWLLGSLLAAFSQGDSAKSALHRKRYVLFTTPVKKNTDINGVAVGLMAVPWLGAEYLKINGINIEVEPFAIMVGPATILGSLFGPFRRDSLHKNESPIDNYNLFPKKTADFNIRINGISLSGGGNVSDTKVNGIAVNGLTGFAEELNGLGITGIMNLHYSFNGLIFAGFRNKTTTGKGVQIALFNTCKSGQLLQIGLLNRIGNRITPVINFSFKKKSRLSLGEQNAS